MIITKKIRSDHTHWACKYKAQTIFALGCHVVGYKPLPQLMTQKSCEFCLYRRSIDALALDTNFEEIGHLVRVDDDGTEWWEYFE